MLGGRLHQLRVDPLSCELTYKFGKSSPLAEGWVFALLERVICLQVSAGLTIITSSHFSQPVISPIARNPQRADQVTTFRQSFCRRVITIE
jgi:hypothetical protein